MFNFLKKLAGGGAKQKVSESVDVDDRVELLKYDGSEILLRSPSVYPLHRTLDITANVPQMDGPPKRRRAEIVLTESRLLENDMREYVGEIEDVSVELQEHLKQRVQEHVNERRRKGGADQRVGERANLTFAVMSRDFKNFKAISGDISISGLKVFVDDAVEVGKNIEIMMNFDDDNFGSIKCRADVVWCRAGDRNHALGLHFTNLTREQTETVRLYIRFVEEYKARMLRRPPA